MAVYSNGVFLSTSIKRVPACSGDRQVQDTHTCLEQVMSRSRTQDTRKQTQNTSGSRQPHPFPSPSLPVLQGEAAQVLHPQLHLASRRRPMYLLTRVLGVVQTTSKKRTLWSLLLDPRPLRSLGAWSGDLRCSCGSNTCWR